MPDLAVPVASRLPRPRWLDPRFVGGLLLVLVSIVAGSRVVAAADDTVGVWAASRDLAAGAPLDRGDLVVARVHLDGREDRYLAPSVDPKGLLATRPLAKGELLAVAAVAHTPARAVRAVSVEAQPASLGSIDENSLVDVYVVADDAPGAASTGSDTATVDDGRLVPVLRGAPVLKVGDDGGRFSSSGTAGVTLQVPESAVGAFLAAVSTGDVQLVEVPGGAAANGATS